ncbi:proto-oncogene tyrosine-protein kinase ros [Lasius niger]|uniref:Proto-oncogene tyrosine-protein kinase ros n=1 Tax=Lasius niger TaxID=67767 RepID=A0A0J7K3S9_LASNI|nr:proto-oncogene tyrosine-protein kinase ros [Lasius niger]
MYYFKVQAHNKGGAGSYTKFIDVSIMHENPVPLLLVSTWIGVQILDLDLQIHFKLNEYNPYREIAYSALEHKIYGITSTWRLMIWDFNRVHLNFRDSSSSHHPVDVTTGYNLATTIYVISVSYLTCSDNDLNKLEEFKVQTYEWYYEIHNLMPLTEYTLKLALNNFYVDKLSMGLQFGAEVKQSTTGKLNALEEVMIQVLTPNMPAIY